jgi:hypothetical protein
MSIVLFCLFIAGNIYQINKIYIFTANYYKRSNDFFQGSCNMVKRPFY